MNTKVLFHARNRRGLGHLMRVQNLATSLVAHAPQLDVHIHTTCSPAAGTWNPALSLSCDNEIEWDRLVERYQPSLVVHDTTIKPCPVAIRQVLILRRRTDEQHDALLAEPALESISRFIVPHSAADFGLPLPPAVAARTSFVGPISRQSSTVASEIRAQRGFDSDEFVLTVTVGGGGFAAQADRFFEIVEAIIPAVGEVRANLRCVVVLGPNYDNQAMAARLARMPATEVVAMDPNLVELLAASDLVIAEGGYNTVTELRLAQIPTVFIPSKRKLDDQWERVQRIADTGAAMVIDPQSPEKLSAMRVVELLRDDEALGAMTKAARREPLVLGNDDAAVLIAKEATLA